MPTEMGWRISSWPTLVSKRDLGYKEFLVLDEMGYLPMNRQEASLFFQLLTRRYEKASLILTSNKSFVDWGEICRPSESLCTKTMSLPGITTSWRGNSTGSPGARNIGGVCCAPATPAARTRIPVKQAARASLDPTSDGSRPP